MAKAVKKVIKCFCNCTELTEDDVKNILLADVRGILINKLGNKLFRKFALLGHRLDVPYAIDMLECYEICDKVIETPECGYDYYERIQELCPDYTLECQLRSLVEDDQPTEMILSCLADIQFECVREIETDIVYRNFRLRLQDKIRKE